MCARFRYIQLVHAAHALQGVPIYVWILEGVVPVGSLGTGTPDGPIEIVYGEHAPYMRFAAGRFSTKSVNARTQTHTYMHALLER